MINLYEGNKPFVSTFHRPFTWFSPHPLNFVGRDSLYVNGTLYSTPTPSFQPQTPLAISSFAGFQRTGVDYDKANVLYRALAEVHVKDGDRDEVGRWNMNITVGWWRAH